MDFQKTANGSWVLKKSRVSILISVFLLFTALFTCIRIENLFSQTLLTNFNHRPWLYFDLGDTLVDTKIRNKIKWLPGAKQYLLEVRRLGMRVGLITNIPETFGDSYEKKLKTLKEYIQKNWIDEESFDWELFDQVILPMFDRERKPALDLFMKAIENSGPCGSMFTGELQEEVDASEQAGLSGHLYLPQSLPNYMAISNLREHIARTYHGENDERCWDNWPNWMTENI